MAAPRNAAPILIRRKKIVAGGGHHGGAWKVAYADFVTAMMAFFLLMWLLGATTERQRKGLANYFDPTIPVDRVLREAIDLNLTSVVVVGVGPDGMLSYWYSDAEPNEAYCLLHKAAQDILNDD